LVALLLVGLVAAGAHVPGGALARAMASRILCAAAMADGCGDEPVLIAAYGTEVGRLVRRHMPSILLERGSRALPVDFRRCRSSGCGDGSARGLVHRTDAGLPVTAFVHVLDRRDAGGSLYIQYWLYYADSATLRDVPLIGSAGYHADDWESVQFRIRPDGRVDERASSHDGYNHDSGVANWGSDAGVGPLRDVAEVLGARPRGGWSRETHMLLVSGGSHAGNAIGIPDVDRLVPGPRVHLVPLEAVAEEAGESYRFAVVPPWLKRVWRDPEAEGTG
jgi:hypothetical protein